MNKKIILIVDDVQFNHRTANMVLQDTYELYNALSAEEAFNILEKVRPDLILLDVVMPVMDGYAAARAIRDLPRDDAGTVLIFACTASTFEEDRRRALDAGMDDFLPKPLNVGLMLQKLEAVRRGLS